MAKLTVKLKIADMEFPFNDVESSEEEIYRHAAKMVNDLHARIPKNTNWVAKQEFALVALQLAMENLRMKTSRSLGDDVDRLADLEKQIDEYLTASEK